MGADYSFYVKTIETHARAFFKVIIFSISSVFMTNIKGSDIKNVNGDNKDYLKVCKAFLNFK